MYTEDALVSTVYRLLTSAELPAELQWEGYMWDDGRLVYRVTVVPWKPQRRPLNLRPPASGQVKMVVNVRNQNATFAIADGPVPHVARYLDLGERQRETGWTAYPGNPRDDRKVWTHLADTVVRIQRAYEVIETHREHDGSFGLVMPSLPPRGHGDGPAAGSDDR